MDCAPFKKPGPGPGFSHTAPAFLLFRKKSRLLGCLAASTLATPLRRCQPFAGYQAQPFQSELTTLSTRQRAGAESCSRLFPLPRTCARIPAGLNGPSFPNKKAPGRVPYLYDPGTAGECIFVRGEIYMLGGSQALLRAEGQQVCAAIGTDSGQKTACFADSVMAIRRGKFHQRFRPVSSSGWRWPPVPGKWEWHIPCPPHPWTTLWQY